jgi:hypothetical protein
VADYALCAQGSCTKRQAGGVVRSEDGGGEWAGRDMAAYAVRGRDEVAKGEAGGREAVKIPFQPACPHPPARAQLTAPGTHKA